MTQEYEQQSKLPLPASPKAFFNHPHGLHLVSFIGLWERFSLYGVLAILVLFLSSSPSQQGFGWGQGESIRFVGIYTAGYLFTPLLGGFIADRWLGQRRTLTLGVTLMMAGHILSLGPAVAPYLVELSSGLPAGQWLHSLTIPLGKPYPPSEIMAATTSASTTPEINALLLSYYGSAISFYIALFFIAVGGGFVSMSAYALIGDLYPQDSGQRDQGYLQFYFWTNIAALLAFSIIGWFGEAIGWHYAFGVAGLGLFIGLVPYLALSKRLLPDTPIVRNRKYVQNQATGLRHWKPTIALVFIYSFGALFFIGYVQINSTLTLFGQQEIYRTVFGFEIPTIWFRLVNAIVTLIGAPMLAIYYRRRLSQGHTVSISGRFTTGLMATAITFALMLLTGLTLPQLGPAILLAVAIATLSIGELLILPTGPLAAYIAARPGHRGLVMATWFLSMAVGVWIGGYIGGLIDSKGYQTVFLMLFTILAFGTVFAFALQKRVTRWLYADTRQDVDKTSHENIPIKAQG